MTAIDMREGCGMLGRTGGEQTAVAESNAIAKVGWTHDAIIDVIVARPEVTQTELCAEFGYTQGWMSRVINSDAFQHRLSERKAELVNPVVTQGLNEKLRAISSRSADVILDALDVPNPPKALAVEALRVSARAAHYGARQTPAVQVNVQQNNAASLQAGAAADRVAPVTVTVEPTPNG